MAIRIRVSGVCFSFSFRHSFRYHPAPKESQGIRAPPEEEIRTSSAGTPCADKQRGQTTLRGRPLCAQLLQQLEPLERQRLPSVGAATPQHLSQRLRTHTHTHTHTHIPTRTHTHTLFLFAPLAPLGARLSRLRAGAGQEEGREEKRSWTNAVREARKRGSALSGITPRPPVSKMPCKKRPPTVPGSGEKREERRRGRGKAAGPN